MKQLAGTIGKILFWVFAVLVFFWTASLSVAALRTILPGDPIKPYVGLVLTDVGALTWLLVFIGQAQGLPQRAISLIMFVIDLAGVILLAAFELLTGGQRLAAVPAEIGTAVIWGVIGLTLVNLAAAYFYHLAHPETWKAIEFGVLTDRLQGEALQQATRSVEAEAQKLGAILAARATAELKYNLRLPMSDFEQIEHTKNLPAPKVIDAKATDQPTSAPSVFSKWRKKFSKPIPSPVATYAADVSQVTEQPAQYHNIPPKAKHYTTDEFCKLGKKTRAEMSAILASYPSQSHAYHYWQARAEWMPDDLTPENFGEIYNDLLPQEEPPAQGDPTWVKVIDAMGILNRKPKQEEAKPANDDPFQEPSI